MTIGKKLYVNFGAVLAMVVVLFLVNFFAVQREHVAKAAAAASLDMAEATDSVKFQMLQNRLFLNSYLLSGDTREVDRMNEGIHLLGSKIQKGIELSISDQQKAALQKLQAQEESWLHEFGNPLVEKRKEVDSGNATVAELQIFYLQKDASSWIKNSNDLLETVNQENKKLVEERRRSDETAATATIVVALLSTLLALGLGAVIAYRSAKSITEPLTNLMKVTRQIGNAGDLEHNIDIQRADEIGELARTYNNMVTYLREMAAVSEAIAGGDLTVKCSRDRRRTRSGMLSCEWWRAFAVWSKTAATLPLRSRALPARVARRFR